MNKFSGKSLAQLTTCHIDLQALANAVLTIHDCTVVCGWRSKDKQNKAFHLGNSTTKYPKSKHNSLPSMAIDLGPYIPNQDVLYNREQTLYFAGIVLGIAHMLYESGIMEHRIRWGGDWDSDNDFKEHKFYDGIHFELIEND